MIQELTAIIISYLPYTDYEDEEIRATLPLNVVKYWRTCSRIIIKSFATFVNGVIHSLDDYPAINGAQISAWYFRDKLHRADGKSARLRTFTSAYLTRIEEWIVHGRYHRENDPAYVLISPYGELRVWFNNGKFIKYMWRWIRMVMREDDDTIQQIGQEAGGDLMWSSDGHSLYNECDLIATYKRGIQCAMPERMWFRIERSYTRNESGWEYVGGTLRAIEGNSPWTYDWATRIITWL